MQRPDAQAVDLAGGTEVDGGTHTELAQDGESASVSVCIESLR